MSDAAPLETLFIAGRATARRLRKARLTVVDGPDRGKTWAMERARVAIGRSAVCEVPLNDRSVSNTHAEIEAVEEGWVLRDLGSTNGTFLGDIKVREVVMPLGARFRVGATLLQIDPGDGAIEIPLSQSDRWQELVGRSVAMRQVFAELDKIAPLDVTVLVTGETGTGKELVARAIHRVSKRAQGPMVVQDCSALPKDLVESILFGHEKGAFTGATERRSGCFEQAHKGTVFLDEVGELEIGLQPKLLRVLEGREVRRLGGTQVIPVDVRVIAATHRDLRALAGSGGFREDLYYRRCARGARTSPCWRVTCWKSSASATPTSARGPSLTTPSTACRPWPFRATCASCATWSSGRPRWPTRPRSPPTTCCRRAPRG
jgi:pSer/pThr/pTyr-binding forkhead associated (FHA) protein